MIVAPSYCTLVKIGSDKLLFMKIHSYCMALSTELS